MCLLVYGTFYLLLCLLVAIIADVLGRSKIEYLGLSLICTPLIMAFVLIWKGQQLHIREE